MQDINEQQFLAGMTSYILQLHSHMYHLANKSFGKVKNSRVSKAHIDTRGD